MLQISGHEISTPYYPALLKLELAALPGMIVVELAGELDKARLVEAGDVTFQFEQTVVGVGPMMAAVEQAIIDHKPTPGPGPAGLTPADLDTAWVSIRYQSAALDARLLGWMGTTVQFVSSIETLRGNVGDLSTKEQREVLLDSIEALGYGLRAILGISGMGMPVDFDPFDEADLVGLAWVLKTE